MLAKIFLLNISIYKYTLIIRARLFSKIDYLYKNVKSYVLKVLIAKSHNLVIFNTKN